MPKRKTVEVPKELKAFERMKNIDVEVPYHVRVIMGNKTIGIVGEQASLSLDGDFSYKEGIRTALEWYVDQFGGKIIWGK